MRKVRGALGDPCLVGCQLRPQVEGWRGRSPGWEEPCDSSAWGQAWLEGEASVTRRAGYGGPGDGPAVPTQLQHMFQPFLRGLEGSMEKAHPRRECQAQKSPAVPVLLPTCQPLTRAISPIFSWELHSLPTSFSLDCSTSPQTQPITVSAEQAVLPLILSTPSLRPQCARHGAMHLSCVTACQHPNPRRLVTRVFPVYG